MKTNELKMNSSHIVIKPTLEFNMAKAMEIVGRYYVVSLISFQIPYRPNKQQTLGMYVNGMWYRLDLRESENKDCLMDSLFLQEKILANAFGIGDPFFTTDLIFYSDKQWDRLLLAIKAVESLVVFTLYH